MEQESVQTVACSTSERHSKDKKQGLGKRATWAEVAAQKIASPMVTYTSRDVHRV